MKNTDTIRFAGVIPARYASSRFPGKPLAIIGGKPMIQRVYEQASKILAEVYVATDDGRIYNCVTGFGGKVVMTSPDHSSGTDRCAEAAVKIENETGREIDVIINIQGDEPFIKPEQLEALMNCFMREDVEIATLIRRVESDKDLFNPNHPKVIVNTAGEAIYFSRSVIPFVRNSQPHEWTEKHTFFEHIGLYAYRTVTLHKITKLPQSTLEIAESLEQNRWIENRYKIMTAITEWESMGIDTPDDLEKANRFIEKQ